MDLCQLRYFVAVVEEGGCRRASRELFVVRPALCAALDKLETELGVELLTWTPDGAQPTSAGHEFLSYARAILAQAEVARSAVCAWARRRPALRIGVAAEMLEDEDLDVAIVQAYRDGNPGVRVDCEELPFGDQAGSLLAGSLDVALSRGPLEHPNLVFFLLANPRPSRTAVSLRRGDRRPAVTAFLEQAADTAALQTDRFRGGSHADEHDGYCLYRSGAGPTLIARRLSGESANGP